ncbi:MAG: CRISPR-associated endonuclease Cas1, partial [Anaerolineae bacterium]|nr:CRISPR-associated endonuclease Cas1 [Anaerolineae bacterium]
METTTLIIDQFGSYLGKHSERLQVKVKGALIAEAPLLTLENILILGNGVSLSTDALRLCAEHGIPVHCLSSRGEPYAALYAAGLGGTVQTRRAQYEAYRDTRGAALAAGFASGKIQNQARLLKYVAKNRKEKDPLCYAALQEAAGKVDAHQKQVRAWLEGARDLNEETRRAELLSIEGRAAQAYWEGVRQLVPPGLAWPGREGRGASDPFNAA